MPLGQGSVTEGGVRPYSSIQPPQILTRLDDPSQKVRSIVLLLSSRAAEQQQHRVDFPLGVLVLLLVPSQLQSRLSV